MKSLVQKKVSSGLMKLFNSKKTVNFEDLNSDLRVGDQKMFMRDSKKVSLSSFIPSKTAIR